MDKIINNIKLYVKETKKAKETEEIIKNTLLNNEIKIDNNNFDLVISVGGDGTFLKMLRNHNYDSNHLYSSVNAGSLGFLSSISCDQISKFVDSLKNDSYKIKKINILKTKVVFDNTSNESLCVNELTIRKSDFSSLRCDIYIDNKLLNKYIGDGLVISTSTGSTAYNLALGGPIIDDELKTITLTPLVPINNKVYKSLSNPLVLSQNHKITIIPNGSVCLVSDGKINNFDKVKRIELSLSDKVINCIVPNEYDYFDNIKNKIIDSKE